MSVTFKTGSILSPLLAQAIVIPVNCMGVPGAGLAKQWATIAPSAAQQYRERSSNGLMKIGEPLLLGRSQSMDLRDWWVCFPTKNHWQDYSELAEIQIGLSTLTKRLNFFKIKSVAFPLLGAGLGGLSPTVVKEALVNYCGTQIPDVEAYIYI